MPSTPSDAEAVTRWLLDSRHNIAKADRFTSGMDYQAFKDNDLHLYAVVRCLEIISDASRRLPADIKARPSPIAWQQMAGAGNIFRHDYEDVSAYRVWHTLTVSLPSLRTTAEAELKTLGVL